MRILVTGGAGFIGSHLCERLLKDGHEVTVIDDLSTGSIENLSALYLSNNFRFIQESILDLNKIEPLIANTDYIFHLAAAVGVFNIVKKPLQSLQTNIRGTENILDLANKKRIPVFISSSSEVYGKNISDSLSETDDRILGNPLTLRWSYSEAKAIDESLAFAHHVENQLEVRIVRFFNTVGPRQLGTYGMVMPRFIQAALRDEPITIYGTGNQTRCFVHVFDVVEAVVNVAFAPNTIAKVLNIGNDFEISMNDLAKKIIHETDSKSEIVYVPYSEAYGDSFEDMERRVPNIKLIKNLVGWQPRLDLSRMISDIATQSRISS